MLFNYKGHRIFAFSDTHGMHRRLIFLSLLTFCYVPAMLFLALARMASVTFSFGC